MKRSISITRRLIFTVLLLELVAAVCLIAAITVNERNIQFKAFDANLRGTADALMGAVQDAEDENDNVMLDLRGVQLGRDSIYRVEDEHGPVLGAAGVLPDLSARPESFQHVKIAGRSYRFFTHHGERIIDPGKRGGVRHSITIIYGSPDGHVWHEVFEAVRFFAITTALLLGVTAILMVWLVRKSLQPIHDLALEAGKVNTVAWRFDPPDTAMNTDELRPLSMALETTLLRLERSFRAQKRFTSDAAHELKTDLAIVKSSLQLLSMKKRTAEEYSRGLSLSLDDFTRLELTVQKMLTLARLEQPVENRGQSCRIKDVVEEAVQQSGALAALKNVSISVHAASDDFISLDSGDALLLCSNILLNAIQHSLENGAVAVELSEAGDQIKLIVRDQGEGLCDQDLSFLFEPFYRGDPSRSRKSGGTGLGLSICRAICERIGGSIGIANHSGGGAIVTVLLPLAQTEKIQ